MGQIYLSYTNHDVDFARKLSEAFVSEGHSVFDFSEGLIPGQVWRDTMDKA